MNASSKIEYRKWAKQEHNLPVWHQPWWLDLAADEKWQVILIKDNNGQIIAVHPFYIRSKFGLKKISQPSLNQCLGPYFSVKFKQSLSHQNMYMKKILASLPSHVSYEQCWTPEILNWLPFYWQNFKSFLYFTYRINLQISEKDLWNNISSSRRREITKANSVHNLKVDFSNSFEKIWPLIHETFIRKKLINPYRPELIQKILNFDLASKKVFGLIAYDNSNTIYASGIFLLDNQRCYYLAGGYRNHGDNSGSMSLLLWNAIKIAHRNGLLIFDFEGSMNENIEFFFNSFGAIQSPYLKIWRR